MCVCECVCVWLCECVCVTFLYNFVSMMFSRELSWLRLCLLLFSVLVWAVCHRHNVCVCVFCIQRDLGETSKILYFYSNILPRSELTCCLRGVKVKAKLVAQKKNPILSYTNRTTYSVLRDYETESITRKGKGRGERETTELTTAVANRRSL